MKLISTRTGISLMALAVFLGTFAASGRAQDSMNVEIDLSHLSLTPSNGQYHILRAHTPAGQSAPLEGPRPLTVVPQIGLLPLVPLPVPGVPAPGFYPGDVTKVVATAKTLPKTIFNPIFINCSGGSCWGNPITFQKDLVKSSFIHLTDQYTKAFGSFSVGTIVNVNVNLARIDDCGIGGTNPCLLDGDIQALISLVVAKLKIGAGYGHLFHVFLPKGVDECTTDSTGTVITGCYSPDVLQDFAFCAYHSAGDQSVGHLVYSVEPYQAAKVSIGGQTIPVCGTAPPDVNGFVSDSTDSTLAHEIFEAISDPDIDAFHDLIDGPLFGSEIGDTCDGPPVFNNAGTFIGSFVPTLVLNGHKYKSQLIYSNHYHACAGAP